MIGGDMELEMFGKNTIISGLVSGAILAAASFATPASAGQATLRLDVGISSFLNELFSEDEAAPTAQKIDYNGVPIRKIYRKMRRRGLYPVSDYRRRGDVVIIRAEDDYGTLFRVVADADYGDILRIRRVRDTSNYRPRPVEPPFYDDGYDNYRPGYDRPARRNKRGYGSTHAERKAAKDAAARANARRRAAKTTHAQRKAAKIRADQNRRARQARADANRRAAQAAADRNRRVRQAAQAKGHAARKAAQLRADANRRARQAAADRNRRARQAAADRNRRAAAGSKAAKKPYVGLSPEEYKIQQYGGGK